MSGDRLNRYRERVFAERARLRAAFRDAAGHQQRVLAHLLDANADTDFGRAHGFGKVRGPAEFQEAVPIHDYHALAPWIERMAGGADGVLTAERPALYFTSSGSTGAHKKIPVTPTFMATTFFPFFYAAWAPMLEHFPAAFTAVHATLNLKHDPVSRPARTGSGAAHLGASQVDFGAAFGEPLSAEPGTRAPWATLPVPVDDGDHLTKAYLRLRMAAEHDVRAVVGINPAMVAAVPYQLRLWWHRILRDIHDGTLDGVPYGDPDPGRARELERLAERAGAVRPSLLWPRLQVIFCWSTGPATLYLPLLREEFGTAVTVLPAPVAASEGPVGVALDRHATAGSLVVTAALYEFADADTVLREDSPTLRFDELSPGREYHVVFSHVGGLYRYAGGDVVRVHDVADGVPRIEYAGRNRRSDVAGEALRESHVITALAAAVRATGLPLRNASCRAEPSTGGIPRYTFAVASATPWSTDETQRFSDALDSALSREAPGYRTARDRGRLLPAGLLRLDGDAFLRDWQHSVATGIRPTQVKDRVFRPDDADWQRLTAARPATEDSSEGEKR